MTAVGGLSQKDTVTRLRQGLNIQISLICPFSLAVNVISKWPQSSVLHRRMKHHVGCKFAIQQIYADKVLYVATLDAPSCWLNTLPLDQRWKTSWKQASEFQVTGSVTTCVALHNLSTPNLNLRQFLPCIRRFTTSGDSFSYFTLHYTCPRRHVVVGAVFYLYFCSYCFLGATSGLLPALITSPATYLHCLKYPLPISTKAPRSTNYHPSYHNSTDH